MIPSDSEIDQAILNVTVTDWRKVARVLFDAEQLLQRKLRRGEQGWNLIAPRVEALIESRQLFVQGDVKQWRHCEVRRAPSQ